MAALDNFEQDPSLSERERLALRYCDNLVFNARGDLDQLYRDLHQQFTKAEIIELGSMIGLNIGFIGHFVHSWHLT